MVVDHRSLAHNFFLVVIPFWCKKHRAVVPRRAGATRARYRRKGSLGALLGHAGVLRMRGTCGARVSGAAYGAGAVQGCQGHHTDNRGRCTNGVKESKGG